MDEILLEERRRQIGHDMNQIRLEEEAMRGRPFQPNAFTRSMETLGKWLITRGESLVKRYESPRKRSQHASPNSYAH
jgi:hypothetical protein